jgi:hypothetical protein
MTSFVGWTVPPAVYTIFYALMFVGAAGFLVVVSRKHAPSARREPFRKPDLIRAAGLLLLAAGGIMITSMDGSPDKTGGPRAWVVLLQVGLAVAGIVLAIIGGLAYRRAGDAYPPGKHADPDSPPERRRLF